MQKNPDFTLLPPQICAAVCLASDPRVLALRPAERNLLCYLLQRVSKGRPGAPFRARLDRLAEEFEVTTRTIHNWLAGLHEKKLLLWRQRRNCFGSFGVAVTLTEKAITALFPKVSSEPWKKISGTDIPNTLKINQPDASEDVSEKPARTGNTLPADLRQLADAGLSTPTIFWLMRQATLSKNRLSTITAYCQQYITGLAPRAIKAYLLKCIASGMDYKVLTADRNRPATQRPRSEDGDKPKANDFIKPQSEQSPFAALARLLGSKPLAIDASKEVRVFDGALYLACAGSKSATGLLRPIAYGEALKLLTGIEGDSALKI